MNFTSRQFFVILSINLKKKPCKFTILQSFPGSVNLPPKLCHYFCLNFYRCSILNFGRCSILVLKSNVIASFEPVIWAFEKMIGMLPLIIMKLPFFQIIVFLSHDQGIWCKYLHNFCTNVDYSTLWLFDRFIWSSNLPSTIFTLIAFSLSVHRPRPGLKGFCRLFI